MMFLIHIYLTEKEKIKEAEIKEEK